MADQATGGGEPQVSAERQRFVKLSTGKTVEVRKWNFVMRNRVAKMIREFMDTLPKDVEGKSKIEGKEFLDLFTVGAGADKMLDLVRISVSKDNVDLISSEMDSDDADALIEATVTLNGGAIKKSMGLPNQFLQILAGANQ